MILSMFGVILNKRLKVFSFFFFLWLLLTCCMNGFAAPVSVDDAIQVAENWMTQKTGFYHEVAERVEIILMEDQQGTFPTYYIFNIRQGGWVIVASDDVAYPIIGYSIRGSMNADDQVPPAFSEWMADLEKEIQTAIQDSSMQFADEEIAQIIQDAWETLNVENYHIIEDPLDTAVAPLVTTTWSQGRYYNNKCPADSAGPDGHVYVGCVATAMSQVMKYHNWPTTGTGSHSYTHATYGTLSANFGATTYNWSAMPSTGQVTSYNDAVATLLYHAGVSIDMNYSPSGSGAITSKVATALKNYFRYKSSAVYENKSSYSSSAWALKVREELDASRPLVYRGRGTGGHAFVCDGYQGTDYFHFNWGWNGAYDGYFYLNDLTPGSANFTNSQAAIFGIEPKSDVPGKATLTSPSGTITDTTPTYTWDAVIGATWYYLWVNDSTGEKIKKWYTSNSACASSLCSVTPTTALANGNGQWWIQTWNSHGYGPWSDGMSFNETGAAGPPGAATLTSPSGTITDTTPTYTWNVVTGATWYYLWANDSTGNKVKKWYTSDSVCSGATCSATPTIALANGNGKWWIKTWNSEGSGPWSDGMSFNETGAAGPPGAATLTSPSGTITDTTPTYTWDSVNGATWYFLWVNDSEGNKIKKWYTSDSACSGSTCSVTPTTVLAGGNGTWWIKTWNSEGSGPWSDGMGFNVSSGTSGFNSQFNGDATGWYRLTGSPSWSVDSHYISTSGETNKWASTYYGSYNDDNTKYADFDYSVKLWRNGSDTSSNGLWFRGNPNPPDNKMHWSYGYLFNYSRNGSYSIWKINSDGTENALRSWTSSSAINTGGAWNVLRVHAVGSTMNFYINGVHLVQVTNTFYTTGKAGFGMYSNGTTGDKLWVDYAILTNVSSTTESATEEKLDDGVIIIDETAIISQGGDLSNGDSSGVGQSFKAEFSALPETASELVPEMQVDGEGPDS